MNQLLPIALILMTTAAIALNPNMRMRRAYLLTQSKPKDN